MSVLRGQITAHPDLTKADPARPKWVEKLVRRCWIPLEWRLVRRLKRQKSQRRGWQPRIGK